VIVGVGVDVVDVARFERVLARTPGIADRLFTAGERQLGPAQERPLPSLAARFAAKEALAKVLGAPRGLAWLDAEVVTEATGRPRLEVRGSVAAAAVAAGVARWHLSLAHDGGSAVAVVVGES